MQVLAHVVQVQAHPPIVDEEGPRVIQHPGHGGGGHGDGLAEALDCRLYQVYMTNCSDHCNLQTLPQVSSQVAILLALVWLGHHQGPGVLVHQLPHGQLA